MSHRPMNPLVKAERPVKASQLGRLDNQHDQNSAQANRLANLKSAVPPPRSK